ncbi:MAG: hypothetical protein HDT28_03890 [Clostridiales bacterium]|nr:hypothetical protein [Clostridiales bacterium]
MHNINNNGFMNFTPVPLENYTLESFLYNECAIEKPSTLNKIMLTVASILAMMKFNSKLLGTNYLIYLVTRYLIKSDYTEKSAIKAIADDCGTYPKVVADNIKAAIKHNPDFIKIAQCAVPQPLYVFGEPTITEVVGIVGTIYKLNYNYTVESESLEKDGPAMNYLEITFDNELRESL